MEESRKGMSIEAKVGALALTTLLSVVCIGRIGYIRWEIYKINQAIRNAPLVRDVSEIELTEHSQHYFRLPNGGVYRLNVYEIQQDGANLSVDEVVVPPKSGLEEKASE